MGRRFAFPRPTPTSGAEAHSALVGDSRVLGDMLTEPTASLASLAVGLATAVGVLLWWSWPTAVLMLALGGAAVLVNAQFPQGIRDRAEAEQAARARVLSAGTTLSRGILTVKGFGAERRFRGHVERMVGEHRSSVCRRGKARGWADAAASITGAACSPRSSSG